MTLGLFALSVIGALVLTFPRENLSSRLAATNIKADQLTVAYLKVWLAAKPEATGLWFALANQLGSLGKFNEALDALAHYRELAPESRRKTDLFEIDLLVRRAFAFAEGSLQRERALAQAREKLRQYAAGLTGASEKMVAARIALTIDDAELAGVLLHGPKRPRADAHGADSPADTARGDSTEDIDDPLARAQPRWWIKMAKRALGVGDYESAANFYFEAMSRAGSDAERREYFIAAVKTLQSGNLGRRAVAEAARHLDLIQVDTELYRFLVRLALAAGDLEAAERWARAMLRLSLLAQLRMAQAESDPSLVVGWQGNAIPVGAPRQLRAAPKSHRPRSGKPGAGPAPLDPELAGREPGLKFDDETYKLGFDVFLARSKLDDAFMLAHSAVRQAPDHIEWRRRLAQVALWTSRPAIALEQWRYLANRLDDEESWTELRKLAKAVNDPQTILEVQLHDARFSNDVALELQVAKSYEDNGDPQAALQWLRQRIERRLQQSDHADARQLTDELLKLAERTGEPDVEEKELRLAIERFGAEPTWQIGVALQQYRQGRLDQTFALLEPLAERMRGKSVALANKKDFSFWALYAELASALQRSDQAELAYRELIAAGREDPNNIDQYAETLLATSPKAAAIAFDYLYTKTKRISYADRALQLYVNRREYARAAALLERIAPEHMRQLERSPGFLSARAELHQQLKRPALARADLLAAHALNPGDSSRLAALIWASVAARDATTLRRDLSQWRDSAANNDALAGAFAAAWMALNEPQNALRYFQIQAKTRRYDYLWHLAYADCLEQTGSTDAAWALRRRAFTELRRDQPTQTQRALEVRERIVALAQQFAPGDAARALLREHLRFVAEREKARAMNTAAPATANAQNDTPIGVLKPAPRTSVTLAPAPPLPANTAELLTTLDAIARSGPSAADDAIADQDGEYDPAQLRAAASELAFSYLMSSESVESARAWLLARYAGDLARPIWARLSVALATKDRAELEKLLDTVPDWLPKLDRAAALQQTNQLAAAQTVAFDAATTRPESVDAQRLFSELAIADGPSARIDALRGYQGALTQSILRLEGRARLEPSLWLTVQAARGAMWSSNNDQLVNLPAHDNSASVGLRYQREPSLYWNAMVYARNAARSHQGARVEWNKTLNFPLELHATLGWRQPAIETPILRAAGMRDLLELRAHYNFSQRDYLVTQFGAHRLSAQDGQLAGRGQTLWLEGGHRLHLSYPDVRVRAVFSRSWYSAERSVSPLLSNLVPAIVADPVAAIVPQGSSQYLLALAAGEQTIDNLTQRAMRPFGEVGIRYNSVSGLGANGRVGFATSFFGADRFAIFWNGVSATPGTPRGTREFGASYQWLF